MLRQPLRRFPSPAGSSYFSMAWDILKIQCKAEFPSPVGVFVFLNLEEIATQALQYLFPSPAGSSYFSIQPEADFFNVSALFPSPAGSSHFSIGVHPPRDSDYTISDPCGVFVFLNNGYFNSEWFDGFRPLRGLRISQLMHTSFTKYIILRFRPLRCLRISQ